MNKIRPDCFRAGLCSLVSSKHLRVITLKLHLICNCLLCSVSCLASLLAFPAAASSFFGRCEQVLSMRTFLKNFLIVAELHWASGGVWWVRTQNAAGSASVTLRCSSGICNKMLSHFLLAILSWFLFAFPSSSSSQPPATLASSLKTKHRIHS